MLDLSHVPQKQLRTRGSDAESIVKLTLGRTITILKNAVRASPKKTDSCEYVNIVLYLQSRNQRPHLKTLAKRGLIIMELPLARD
jgi:hypothetical protein